MHFCVMANYTPQAITAIMDNPDMNRLAAISSLVEAAGGKVVSLYSTMAAGPGVLCIIDVPDPGAAPAIVGVVKATGALEDVRVMRLMTPEEVRPIRHKAAQIRSAYKPPGR
ncbi:MAG TPA: GYD domain-containing protein [Acetobacteraceae bacterium]|nr:GYD domain-containing protein [Acetobacteraceae bacterium]